MVKLIRSVILGALAIFGPCSCVTPGTTWELNAGFHADVTSTPPVSTVEVRYADSEQQVPSKAPQATTALPARTGHCCHR